MPHALRSVLLVGLPVALSLLLLQQAGLFLPLDSLLATRLGLPPLTSPWGAPLLLPEASILLAALGIACTTLLLPRPAQRIAVATVALAEIAALPLVLAPGGHFFPPTAPLLAGASSFILALLWRRSALSRHRLLLHHTFAPRLAPETLAPLLDSRHPLPLGGHTLNAAVLVCAFDPVESPFPIETSDPALLAQRANLLLSRCSTFLLQRHAYLDALDGNSLRVLFGAPIPLDNPALHAAHAALDLESDLRRFILPDLERQFPTLPALRPRLALESGPLLAALHRAGPLTQYTISGLPLDRARRLARAAALYRVPIILGPDAHRATESRLATRPLDLIHEPGQHLPHEIYQLLDRSPLPTPEAQQRLESFWQAVIHFRSGNLPASLAAFHRSLPPDGDPDPATAHYLSRIHRLQRESRLPPASPLARLPAPRDLT